MNNCTPYKFNTKRLIIALITIVLVACLASCIACNKVSDLSRIAAQYSGDDVDIGATLNKDDIIVVAYYTDNTRKAVKNYELTYDFSVAGQQTVLVTYVENGQSKTTYFYVYVTENNIEPEPPSPPNPPEPPVPTATLESITAVYHGNNIKVGGTLNNDDITVTAYYSDECSSEVANFEIGGFSSAIAGICNVTVSYSEDGVTKEYPLSITIEEKQVEIANYGKYGIKQQDGSIKITNTAVVNDNLQIHFLAFENNSPGDSIYIKAGDKDILIDAGSTDGCATVIDNYIKKYCTDGILEYVIATHADNDHISAFVGDGTNGILDKYKCETIIKYTHSGKNTQVRKNFEAKCQTQVDNYNTKLYTALQCWNETDGAKRVYKLTDNIEMEILFHEYYNKLSSDENNQSVCVMFNQYGEGYDFDNPSNPNNKNYVNHYLFTGDLEEGGEKSLVANNPNLPEVVLFKGGHHGSATSSNTVLLDKINPKFVCVCTCCGDGKYDFPKQEFINRVAGYTDMVFLTNQNVSGKSYSYLNGNITVMSDVNGVFVNCSNNNILFKDTEWFKNNRECPDVWKSTSN